MNNYMKTEFLAKSVNEGFIRVSASAFISSLDPTIEDLADIKTALSEAVTNAIVHAYPDECGKIIVEMEIKGRSICISVKDFGIGIDDVAQARKPLFTTKPDLERSGMGFTVMESFMDTLHIISTPKQGTTVIMTKKLK